eukprot:3927151-Prymnesium_polylepis.1
MGVTDCTASPAAAALAVAWARAAVSRGRMRRCWRRRRVDVGGASRGGSKPLARARTTRTN